jgi:hypothetical protein
MMRNLVPPGLLAVPTACAMPAQRRAQCGTDRTRCGISHLLPPESRQSPDCATHTP